MRKYADLREHAHKLAKAIMAEMGYPHVNASTTADDYREYADRVDEMRERLDVCRGDCCETDDRPTCTDSLPTC